MKCSFCGKVIKQGTGKVLAFKTGELVFLCSSKCEKNMRLKRKPQKLKWTKTFQRGKKVSEEAKKKKKKIVVKTKKDKKKLSKKERRALRKKKKEDKKKKKKQAAKKKQK
jgi:large subunit ribosomal protein L24e